MNDRKIYVQHDGIRASLASVGRELEAIDAVFDDLEARARDLRESWDGEARVAFTTAHRSWDASIRRLSAIHAGMVRVASSGIDRFETLDTNSARTWQV